MSDWRVNQIFGLFSNEEVVVGGVEHVLKGGQTLSVTDSDQHGSLLEYEDSFFLRELALLYRVQNICVVVPLISRLLLPI